MSFAVPSCRDLSSPCIRCCVIHLHRSPLDVARKFYEVIGLGPPDR